MQKHFHFLLIIFFGLLLCLPAQVAASPLYGQKIFATAINDGHYQQAVADLKAYLQKSTGKTFTTATYGGTPTEGINIVLNAPGLLPVDQQKKLANGTIEDFVVSGNDKRLLLVAKHPKGLALAIYSYLDGLGFKWYFPGEEWVHVPSLTSIRWVKEAYVTPSFHLRNFFGTGGIVPNPALDPTNSLQHKWDLWKLRNRMGGEVELPGHYGETFNLNYRPQLEAHPEYLALINGKRVPWSVGAKWCISNKALRDLFINDRVQFVKRTLSSQPGIQSKIIVPVDPADGYDDCQCPDCQKLGTGSDRVFFLANEVARAVAKVTPLAYPNLYAYNTHATPPPFSLEPNLIVQVIPYAFQNVGTPQQMMAMWQKKVSRPFMYDYYGLPDWHFDTPLTGIWAPQSLVQKIKDWKAYNMQGFLLESSFSTASTGISLYWAARLGWNVEDNMPAVQKNYYTHMFGAAAPHIIKYYEKLQGNFAGVADLPYLLSLLDQAMNAVPSAEIHKRIEHLQAYVHYLSLYYGWDAAPAEEKERAWEALVSYVWKIHPLAVIHTTRIAELLSTRAPANPTLTAQWNVYTPGEKVRKTKFINSSELAGIIKEDRKKYPLLPGFNYTGIPAPNRYVVESKGGPDEINPEGMMVLAMPDIYIQPAADGFFRFLLKVNETSVDNAHQTNVVRCVDAETGQEVFKQTVAIDKAWKKIAIKLPAAKRYRLLIEHPNWIRIHIPQNQWAGFKNIPTYTVLGTLWFYINPGTNYIYFTNKGTEHPLLLDENKKSILLQKVNDQNLYRVAVPPSSYGKWWTLSNTQYKMLQFYTNPDLFFSHPNITVKKQ